MTEYEYLKIHKWVELKKGKASYCSFDRTHKSNKYDWANISGNYEKDVKDYISLCRSCHMKMDGINKKKIKQFTKDDVFLKEWTSYMEVERTLGILHTSICNVLAGRAKTAGGYRWLN